MQGTDFPQLPSAVTSTDVAHSLGSLSTLNGRYRAIVDSHQIETKCPDSSITGELCVNIRDLCD
jgi:hypothetical protein